MERPAIRAALFDMDGLLLNTEDLYTICTNEVLHEYGKPDLPWNIKAQLQGRPAPEVVSLRPTYDCSGFLTEQRFLVGPHTARMGPATHIE